MNRKRDKATKLSYMKPIGRLAYHTRLGRFWHDGDGSSFVLNWWNPLAYLWLAIILPLSIILQGVPETFKNKYEFGIGLSPYWQRKKNEREFF